jgi:hypothetical protein
MVSKVLTVEPLPILPPCLPLHLPPATVHPKYVPATGSLHVLTSATTISPSLDLLPGFIHISVHMSLEVLLFTPAQNGTHHINPSCPFPAGFMHAFLFPLPLLLECVLCKIRDVATVVGAHARP